MKPGDEHGKGTFGCIISLALIGAAVLVGIRIVPVYYAVKSFETDVKTEVSRAGAHFYSDETLVNNLVELANRNEIHLNREDVKLERLAGQVFVNIHYSTPVDFFVTERTLNFDIKASSFIGRL